MRSEDEVSLLEHDHEHPSHSHFDPRCSHCQITSPETYFSRHSRVRSLGSVALWVFTIVVTFFLGQRFAASHPSIEDLGTGHRSLNKLIRLQREYHDLQLGEYSPYTSDYGPEVDSLWDEITAPPGKVGMIVVSKEELASHNLTSTRLSDGSGYLATIDVFHQLHCLDMLRKDILNPTGKVAEELWREHVGHCIDSIRLSLQCHADTSLLTFKWIEGYSIPWPDFRTHRTCRNFEDIRQWASERIYVQERHDWVHPILGDQNVVPNPLKLPGGVKWLDDE
ncbi:hypothetical protein HD806DRAFT_493002 [Xylariaceae sp. AK1471]|nr:hypothetical protein HD806DRAFT_493002 [Xylariaceae sp. AK1471]